MKRHFKIIHFIPDPISGARIPMGAVVYEGRGFQMAFAKHLPDADCLGGRKTARLLNFLIDDLKGIQHPSELYQKLGPQILVDDQRPIPEEVADAVTWLENFILPRPAASQKRTAGVRRPSRYAEGKGFLDKHDVGKYVRRSFKPQRYLKSSDEALRHLATISQWVAGDGELLLMEPLIPRRPEWEVDLTEINTRFSAYRHHVTNGLDDHRGELIVYILPGGTEEVRTKMHHTLKSSTAVVDTDDAVELGKFIDLVHRVGEAQTQLGL